MRDPRFPSRSTLSSDLVSQAQVVASETWGAPLVDELSLVLRESQYWEHQREFSLSTSCLADRLTNLGAKGITVPEEIISALNKSFDSPADSPISAQAAWCWGSALARLAAEAYTARELHILLDCARPNPVIAEALSASVARMISKKQPGVVAAVREEVDRLQKTPGAFVLGKKTEGYAESLAEWRTKPPYEAFELGKIRRTSLDFPFVWFIGQLRKIDTDAYLSWLDSLQNPNLIEDSFRVSEVLEDFDEIIRLLKSAPRAYHEGESSHWASIIAPILLETALDHAQTLLIPFARLDRDLEAQKKLSEDLSHRMECLARILDNRSDGCELAAHWLLRLVRVKTQRDPWRAFPPSIAIQALVKVFGDNEAHAAAVVQFIPPAPTRSPDTEKNLRLSGVGQPLPRLTPATDFLIARLLMKVFRQDTLNFQSELREFSSLLLARDPGLSNSPDAFEMAARRRRSGLSQRAVPVDMATWKHRLVGHTLLGGNTVETWMELWCQTEEQRRRRRHIAFTADFSADEPSLFLCSTGLSLLEEKRNDLRLTAPVGLELWNAVYEAVWFMTLVYGFRVGGEAWRYLLTVLIAVLPRHLDLASENGSDRLTRLLSSFACDEELITHSVARLFHDGVSAKSLMSALDRAGVQLEPILARLDQFPDDVSMYPLKLYYGDAVPICREVLNVPNEG